MLPTILATLPFLGALALVGLALHRTLAGNGAKILAALQGRSVTAQPAFATRPVTVRFNPRRTAARFPLRAEPRLSVAA